MFHLAHNDLDPKRNARHAQIDYVGGATNSIEHSLFFYRYFNEGYYGLNLNWPKNIDIVKFLETLNDFLIKIENVPFSLEKASAVIFTAEDVFDDIAIALPVQVGGSLGGTPLCDIRWLRLDIPKPNVGSKNTAMVSIGSSENSDNEEPSTNMIVPGLAPEGIAVCCSFDGKNSSEIIFSAIDSFSSAELITWFFEQITQWQLSREDKNSFEEILQQIMAV